MTTNMNLQMQLLIQINLVITCFPLSCMNEKSFSFCKYVTFVLLKCYPLVASLF